MLKRLLHRSYYRSAGFNYRLRALTPTGWCVLFAMLAAGAIGVDTSEAMSFQSFALLLSILFVAGIWYCCPQPRMTLRRQLPRYGSAGNKLSYRVFISNPNRRSRLDLAMTEYFGDFRPTLEEFLRWSEPGEEHRNAIDRAFGYYRWLWLLNRIRPALAEETALPILPPESETELRMEILPLRRGLLRFEPAVVSARDPLGLARRSSRVGERDSVLILPKIYPIPAQVLRGRRECRTQGMSTALSIGSSEEFVSIREYRRGDPLRHVHWKSSARADRLLVREFQDEFLVRQAIVLDTFGDRCSPELFEEVISLAASFATALRANESLLDFVVMRDGAAPFAADLVTSTLEEVLQTLAAIEPCRDGSFDRLADLVMERLPGIAGMICIFLAWDEPRRELVRRIQGAGISLQVFLIVEEGQSSLVDRGPRADRPESFVCLEAGRIESGLARLR